MDWTIRENKYGWRWAGRTVGGYEVNVYEWPSGPTWYINTQDGERKGRAATLEDAMAAADEALAALESR